MKTDLISAINRKKSVKYQNVKALSKHCQSIVKAKKGHKPASILNVKAVKAFFTIEREGKNKNRYNIISILYMGYRGYNRKML